MTRACWSPRWQHSGWDWPTTRPMRLHGAGTRLPCAEPWRTPVCPSPSSGWPARMRRSPGLPPRWAFPACSSRSRSRAAGVSSGPTIRRRRSSPRNGSGRSWPTRARIRRPRYSSSDTSQVMKSPSRACFGVGPSSPSRCSTSPIRWRAPTSRKPSTSPRPVYLRRR